VPAALLDLLGDCVEEDPADRPKDATDLAERLAKLVEAPKVVAPAPPKKIAIDLPKSVTNSLGIKFTLIPAGTFLMGSESGDPLRGPDEGPQRRVTIEQPFYLGVHPITQQQYEAVMHANPSQFRKGHGGGPKHPVEQVSWDEANDFCRRLSEAIGQTYRLPTEAEWEYACRAGTTTGFAFGDALCSTAANFDGTRPFGAAELGPFLQRTSPVGAYTPNGWGLYDMHGNLWEWCADWYEERYYADAPAHDPKGPSRGNVRVLRGGSWNNSGHLCRSARRNKYAPDFKSETIGFRVVLVVDV
jgi:formylglycine-generating enzyme required for sulfatase activity